MTINDLNKALKFFTKYNESIDNKKYSHNTENFDIIIFNDSHLFQSNSDHEKQGIELQSLEDLKIRFKSFTGENL